MRRLCFSLRSYNSDQLRPGLSQILCYKNRTQSPFAQGQNPKSYTTSARMADNRPVFFFDIDNCVRVSPLDLKILLTEAFNSFMKRVSSTSNGLTTPSLTHSFSRQEGTRSHDSVDRRILHEASGIGSGRGL